MAGMIPMRELRALAKRAGVAMHEWRPRAGKPRVVEISIWGPTMDDGPIGPEGGDVKGCGRSVRAAQIQARENAKIFLEAALAMRYGEGE